MTDPQLTAISCPNISLGQGTWTRRFDLNRDYMLSLEPEAFLEGFHRIYAPPGVPEPKPTVSWGGWLGPRGKWQSHESEFHGHYLSALARIIALTGDAEARDRARQLVSGMARYRQPNGTIRIGFITEKNLDNLLAGVKDARVVLYGLHKMLMGLYELYVIAGDAEAWEIARPWADDLARRVNAMTDEQMETMLKIEHGGIAEVMLDIAAVSGRQEHLDAGLKLIRRAVIEPLARGEDALTDVHCNTTIPVLHGAARAYELTRERRYRDAVENFWRIVQETRTYVTGSSSHIEYWRKPNALKATLCACTQETCVSYNWLRLTDYLLRWTGDAKYADAYERCRINGILAAQHPGTGQFIYFLPLKPGPRENDPDAYDRDPPEGGSKHFGRPLRCFWCCYGTGVQAFAGPLDATYYRDGDGIRVAQFIDSRVAADLPAGRFALRQKTPMPMAGTVRLTVEEAPAAEAALTVRIPAWTAGRAEVRVNGQPVNVPKGTPAWLPLKRRWRSRDTVTLNLPMHLSTEGINDYPNCRAVLFGPHVLVGCVPDASRFRPPSGRPEEWLEDQGGCAFRTKGPDPIRFLPLAQVTSEEYNVYFDVAEEGGA